jgi:hypothetical protein
VALVLLAVVVVIERIFVPAIATILPCLVGCLDTASSVSSVSAASECDDGSREAYVLGAGGAPGFTRPAEFAFVFDLASRYTKVHVNDSVACDDACFEAAFNTLCFNPSVPPPPPGSFCASHPTYPRDRIDTSDMGKDATTLYLRQLENADIFVIAPNGTLSQNLASLANRMLGAGSALYAAFLPRNSGAMAEFGMDAIAYDLEVHMTHYQSPPDGYHQVSGAFSFPHWNVTTDLGVVPIRIFSPLFYDEAYILTGVLTDPKRFPSILVVRSAAP